MEPDDSLPPTSVKGLELKWNNSDIDSIDDSIVFYSKKYDDDLLYVWQRKKNKVKLTPIRILKYKDDIPFIVEEFKKIFMLPTVGKHKATIKGQTCIVTKYENDIPYDKFFETHTKTHLSKGFIKEMQRLYIFRFLICLNCNYENRIEIRQPVGDIYPISCREVKFSFCSDENACRLPNNLIKDWFNNDHYSAILLAKEMIEDFDIMLLKFKLCDIVHKYEHGKYIGWVNTIYDRLLTVKYI
jgi:hypothetical protein